MIVKKSLLIIAALGCCGVGGAAVAASKLVVEPNQAVATYSTSTRRIYIYNTDNWWTDSSQWALYCWNDNGSVAVAQGGMTKLLGDYWGDYGGLCYADITLTGATENLKVIVRNSTSWGSDNQTGTLDLGALGSADAIQLVSGNSWNNNEKRNDRNANVTTINFSSADDLGKVQYLLANYDTCSSATTNGYGAWPQLNATILAGTLSSIKTSTASISDAGIDKGYKGNLPSVAEKIAALESQYDKYK